MKIIHSLVGTLLALLVSVVLIDIPPLQAQPVTWRTPHSFILPPGVPPLVRFTGTLLPPDEAKQGIDTLQVSIEGKDWIFKIDKVRELTGPAHGQMILEDIFPPKLRFVGPDEFIAPLQQGAIANHPITVDGRLYIAHHMFLVTWVEDLFTKEKGTRNDAASPE
ncbi:MAG: hypothetical protein AB7G75_08055 [Candidatus Binatia bacterium]